VVPLSFSFLLLLKSPEFFSVVASVVFGELCCLACYTRFCALVFRIVNYNSFGIWDFFSFVCCRSIIIMSSAVDQQKKDQLTDRAHELYYRAQQNAPTSRQILGLVTLLVAGGLLLLLGGLALTGTTITVLLATPVLILFSPVLIPLAVVAFFTIGGLLGAGTFGVAVLSAISWAYNYYKGRHPFGADQVLNMIICEHCLHWTLYSVICNS
jgi:hypothetical protein